MRSTHRHPSSRLRLLKLEDRLTPSAAGLVAWLPGDGSAADVTGHGHNATPLGGVSYAPAIVSQGFEFDGLNDYLNVSDGNSELNFTTAFTIEAWVRIDAKAPTGLSAPIVHKDSVSGNDRAYTLTVAEDGRLYSAVFGPDGSDASASNLFSAQPIPLGQLTHVALVYDGPAGRHDLYINGQLSDGDRFLNSGSVPASLHASSQPLLVGAYLGGAFPAVYTHMGLDELKMYNRALTGAEVQADAGAAAMPIAWYNYGAAGPATLLADSAGHGFDATSTGTTFVADRPPNADLIAGVPLNAGSLQVDGNFGSGGQTSATDILTNAGIQAYGGFTMETWFNRTSLENSYPSLQKLFQVQLENFFIPYEPNTQIGWSDGISVPPLFATIGLNEWHHVAAVYTADGGPLVNGVSQGRLKLYVDGQQVYDQPETLTAARDNAHEHLYIGRSNSAPETFAGKLFGTRVMLGPLAPGQFLLPGSAPQQQAPVVNAGGPYTITYGSGLALAGSASDADGDALSLSWTVNGHAGAASAANNSLTWSALQALGVTAAGDYTVALTADDGHGHVVTSAPAALHVNQATPVVHVTGGSFVFNELAHPATGSVTGVLGENLGSPSFTYSYTDDDGHRITSSTPPVEPGYYTVTASFAGNANYQPAAATATITIAFEARTLTDLSKAFNAGRTIPIKLQLTDAAGNNVSSAGISVAALRLERLNPTTGQWQSAALQDSGNANPNNLFRYDASLGGYVFNLSTKGLAAGAYRFTWMADGDPTEHYLGFRLV